MKQMRWRISLLIIWLVILFNIERLDFERGETINLASFFYVLAAATAILFLFIPLRRVQAYLAVVNVLAAYVVLKIIYMSPFFSGVHKYLTVTEVVALCITTGLAWLVSQGLQDFEQAVEAISLPKGRPQLLDYENVHERIHAEMSRARRHQHPISVVMLELEPVTYKAALHQAVREAQTAMIKRYVQVRFGLFLTKHVRGTDVIAHYTEDGRFLLLAPESPAEHTQAMLSRLARQIDEQMGIRFRYSIADFPNAALTSEELLRRVTEDLERRPASALDHVDDSRLEANMVGADTYTTRSVRHEHGNGVGEKR
jgi:GGDEF domain-containing protein